MRALIVVLVLALAASASAQTPRRVALVIANSAYAAAPRLANTRGDGDLVAAALRGQGYEVDVVRDASAADMAQALQRLREAASGADSAVVYLAGHGVLDRDASYFLGVDAPREMAWRVDDYSVSVADAIIATRGAHRRMVLFDACRNSPFQILRAPQPRGVGFAMASVPLGPDTWLAHAARRGAVAFDGLEGERGPFAAALAARLASGGDADWTRLLEAVRGDVALATGSRQEPALLMPAAATPPPAAPPPTPTGDCPDCPATVAIPAGSFLFGSPPGERGRDDDEVAPARIALRAFDITRHEITRAAFARFFALTGRTMAYGCEARAGEGATISLVASASWYAPGFSQGDRDPVVCVDWEDARAYAAWLSQRTGRVWRLPTEAEWEYAARAGSNAPFFWGDDRATCAWGNGDDLTAPVLAPAQCRDGYATTAPVGSFKANAWGLFDTAGNVWEWTLDCDDGAARPPPADGGARTEGACANRTIRGGSFDYGPNFLRSASRHRLAPDARNASVGFRLVRER